MRLYASCWRRNPGRSRLSAARVGVKGILSEYITGLEVFSDRSDAKTLLPMLNTLSRWHKARYEEVVADAGYESLENYLYLEQNGQT